MSLRLCYVHYHIDREQLRSIFLISSISLLKKVFTSMWAGSVLFSFLFARHDFTSYVNHKLEQRALLLLEKPTPQVPKEIHGENCFLGGKAPHRIFPFLRRPFSAGAGDSHTCGLLIYVSPKTRVLAASESQSRAR